MVVVALTVTGAEYRVPVVEVGVLPSVVYRIEAPEVVVLMVTV
jgi:TATA-box binding protein (TBP) (component of TFIID and TFIIIB)